MLSGFLAIIGGLTTGCDVWHPPPPTPEELDRGLVVMYPGTTNTCTEMIGFYTGLRDANVDQAIEVVPWGLANEPTWAHEEFWSKFPTWAENEAARLAAYKSAHPGAPVTLLGWSAGAMTAIQVTEHVPDGVEVDSVILLSPGVSPDYDLTRMLEKVSGRAVVYWSPKENNLGLLLLKLVGTVDGNFDEAVSFAGFRGSYDRRKFAEVPWQPEMASLGNNGDHLDYFLAIPWIREYVAAWVAPPLGAP